ncbi:MAG TPA: hypothetical protein VFN37_14915 [Candidatus Baltobacteraceae bacterium]|nr:hypothetical protein [Candidatus Baltobacteraceae bacterium]
MNRYVEFHLGRTITLTALSELLTDVSVQRFQGFVRVNEVGEGRFVLSFARAATADVSLLTLIRENPSQLYAERSVALLGDWVLEVYTGEIAARTGALIATEDNGSLHSPSLMPLPTFADWLLDDPQRHASAAEAFERYGPVVPLALRGVVNFKERFAR